MASNSIIHKKTKQIDMDNFGISVWNGHKIMNYTSKTRLKALKRDHYAKLIENWKSNNKSDKFINYYEIKNLYVKNIVNN